MIIFNNTEIDITYEDPRYPMLILRNDYKTLGYSLNLDTLELSRVCICCAYSAEECVCGAWDV